MCFILCSCSSEGDDIKSGESTNTVKVSDVETTSANITEETTAEQSMETEEKETPPPFVGYYEYPTDKYMGEKLRDKCAIPQEVIDSFKGILTDEDKEILKLGAPIE